MLRRFRKWWSILRFGDVTRRVVATAGHNVAAEIEYYDRNGRSIGYFAYGRWEPGSLYTGEQE